MNRFAVAALFMAGSAVCNAHINLVYPVQRGPLSVRIAKASPVFGDRWPGRFRAAIRAA